VDTLRSPLRAILTFFVIPKAKHPPVPAMTLGNMREQACVT
jgi:hypothetical protein